MNANEIFQDSLTRFAEAWSLGQYDGKTEYIMGLIMENYIHEPENGFEPSVPIELTATEKELDAMYDDLYELVDGLCS